MDVLVITQARTGSTRLPNKVLKSIKGVSLLEMHVNRILKAKKISKLVIATTNEKEDDNIVEIANKLGITYHRGSMNDVLDRFYQTAKKYNPKWIVRITSDCPLIDSALIDSVIEKAKANDLDYCSNTLIEAFPDGQDIEVFKFTALETAWENAKLLSEREHVTPYIRNNSTFFGGKLFKSDNYPSKKNYNSVRLTVDEFKDFEVIKYLIDKIGFEGTWMDYTNEYLSSSISEKNMDIKRNEGYQSSIDKENNL